MRLEYTEQAQEVLAVMEETAHQMKFSYIGTEHRLRNEKIGTEHILLAILKSEDTLAIKLLNSMAVNLKKTFVDTLVALGMDMTQAKRELGALSNPKNKKKSSFPTLEQYSRDLTEAAREDRLDPVVGRNAEVERVMQRGWHR